ncbi:hypothetical protein V6N12_065174 [Hibiscus sabdariffa]|uniref:RNase H type-1 domain-containing protein n=1 Tax=Hibiscus sabdariffa TaxID=183260 RepID=A0ABR2G7Y6_9ROSI
MDIDGQSLVANDGTVDSGNVGSLRSYMGVVSNAWNEVVMASIPSLDDVTFSNREVSINTNGLFPAVAFSKDVHARIDYSMRRSLIVRMLGRSIGYKTLRAPIKAMEMCASLHVENGGRLGGKQWEDLVLIFWLLMMQMVGDIGDMENGNRSVDQGTQVLDVEVGRSSPRGICNKTMLKRARYKEAPCLGLGGQRGKENQLPLCLVLVDWILGSFVSNGSNSATVHNVQNVVVSHDRPSGSSSCGERLFFFWNCQGAASSNFRRHFKEFYRINRPHVVALLEPRISGAQADSVLTRLGFSHSFRVEVNGLSGGIWLLWNNEVDIEVLTVSNQFVHGQARLFNFRWVFFMVIYASPNATIRRNVWDFLSALRPAGDGHGSWAGILTLLFVLRRGIVVPFVEMGVWSYWTKKKELLAQIRGIDRALRVSHSEFLVQLDVELRAGLDEVLRQDERFWLLKSGVQWVKFGDRVMRKAFTVPVTDDEGGVDGVCHLWGVLRNHVGDWLLGFYRRVGVCSVLEAELWGIAEGLRLPWDAGIRVVLLEVDNGDVARIVQDNAYVSGLHGLVPTISELVGRDWVVRVCQIRRTTNMVTDGMVKLARSSFVSSLLDVGLLLGFFRCLMMRLFT